MPQISPLSIALVLGALTPVAWADDKSTAAEVALKKWEASYESEILPLIKSRCIECHSGEEPDGGFDIAKFDSGATVSTDHDVWERVGKRIRLKEMPPDGSPQLKNKHKGVILRWLDARPNRELCESLATDETKSWYPGYVMSRRLSRTEYINALTELFSRQVVDEVFAGGDLDVPSDGAGGEGFDTDGSALFTSAIHIERYLAIAAAVLKQPNEWINTQDTNEDAARDTIAALARRAWRRPVETGEIDRLMMLFQSATDRGADFHTALTETQQAVLISPHFLFVIETEAEQGGVQPLTPHQMATRLALFLWSSIPDQELLQAADDNLLSSDEQLIAQTQRMLKDDRVRALGENFGLQWLGLTNFLTTTKPDHDIFPDFNPQLAKDMREEAIRSVASVFQNDQSILHLLDSDHVIVNARLAKHYGMAFDGDDWKDVESEQRGGVITLAAVLASSSYPRRTSPVLRGRWLLEEMLGDHVPPPPPGVPALETEDNGELTTMRQRLEIHRQNAECASCHDRMDPLGFGLENFDALGRWRTQDNGLPVDATGKLPSGETFAGPVELKRILMNRSADFEKHFAKKLLGFALGRELNNFDDCVVEDCLKGLKSSEHRATSLIETIVTSYPFRNRFFKAAK